MTFKVLVTGGAGFIGSHACVALVQAGCDPVVLDNLSNADGSALERIARISGYRPALYKGDVQDGALLDSIFASHRIHAVVHFAGLKSVGDSVSAPLSYYDCNVHGSLSLVSAMARAEVRRLIFSSSATVYGEPDRSPVSERAPMRPCSPYGRSKLMVEAVLGDLARTDARWRIALLRYFNPAGAHESGLLGERITGTPNNLVPILCKVAAGSQDHLTVYGDDYPTHDGTCMRDYVHVMDVADGHVAALHYLEHHAGAEAFNLGVGRGTSVLELLEAFRRASGREVPHRIGERRAGDAAAYWADVRRAQQVLNWNGRRSLDDICNDTWRWQQHAAAGDRTRVSVRGLACIEPAPKKPAVYDRPASVIARGMLPGAGLQLKESAR